jgi:hypothetical protein
MIVTVGDHQKLMKLHEELRESLLKLGEVAVSVSEDEQVERDAGRDWQEIAIMLRMALRCCERHEPFYSLGAKIRAAMAEHGINRDNLNE